MRRGSDCGDAEAGLDRQRSEVGEVAVDTSWNMSPRSTRIWTSEHDQDCHQRSTDEAVSDVSDLVPLRCRLLWTVIYLASSVRTHASCLYRSHSFMGDADTLCSACLGGPVTKHGLERPSVDRIIYSLPGAHRTRCSSVMSASEPLPQPSSCESD